ncbi:MAG: hypothetical protein KatS3mg094_545 [Candidatus Parcubacteria bacterium]|nr:MAG: hypothetical protein KatS3mg094_545 [Candidatus Parcubacteria bacterium]
MESKEIKIRINPRIFWYIIFILLLIFLAFLTKRILFSEKYVGVYFLNGELYIGKISYLPKLKLIDPYLLRFDQQTNNTILIPLVQLPWGPQNQLYLNKSQILWIAPLNENSQIFSLLKDRNRMNNQQSISFPRIQSQQFQPSQNKVKDNQSQNTDNEFIQDNPPGIEESTNQ